MGGYVRTESGLIVPASFAEGARAPVIREVAGTGDGRDITRGWVSALPILSPQDSILAARGNGNYQIYREVLRDDQVKTALASRQRAVISREWEVIPGGDQSVDEQAADFLREQLKRIRFDAVTEKMLYGVFYGYAVAEVLWRRDGARVVMDQIRVRDRRRFAYDNQMRLRLLTVSNPSPGEELPARKFWHFATGADHDDEPYGLGLAHWLYWPVYFKRGGIKLWMTFLDKFGAPTAKGTYPPNATTEEKNKLLAALGAITSDSGVIIPEGMAIELIEAGRSGSSSYETLFDRMDRAIAKVVLGQVATTEGTPGKLGGDDAQQDVRMDLVKADADLVCESFNRSIAQWLTEYNFPSASAPQVWRKLDDEEDVNQVAERDQKLTAVGYRPTLERITEIYGEGYEPVARPGGGAPPEFAEGDERETVDQQIDQLEEQARPAITAMIDTIRELVDQVASLEELRDRLLEIYTDLDDRALGEAMTEALAAANLAGRYELLEGA